jgi:hypothetical protein
MGYDIRGYSAKTIFKEVSAAAYGRMVAGAQALLEQSARRRGCFKNRKKRHSDLIFKP